MGICFCCFDEGAKVGKILDKFPPVAVSQALDGLLQMVVGRIVLAGTSAFYTPSSNTPCVWYKVKIEEEREVTHANGDPMRDENGKPSLGYRWEEICNEEKCVDFYLQDGVSKVFVQGSNRGLCKIQSESKGGGIRTNFFNDPPVGIRRLIQQSNSSFKWGKREGFSTGRYRYTEQSFDVNEKLAAFGFIQPANDPYLSTPVKTMNQFTNDTLNQEYFQQNGWEEFDIRSWNDLTKNPCVLLSDNQKYTGPINVLPIQNLPTWMISYVPTHPMIGVNIVQPVQLVPPIVAVQPVQMNVVAEPVQMNVQMNVAPVQMSMDMGVDMKADGVAMNVQGGGMSVQSNVGGVSMNVQGDGMMVQSNVGGGVAMNVQGDGMMVQSNVGGDVAMNVQVGGNVAMNSQGGGVSMQSNMGGMQVNVAAQESTPFL